MFNSTINCAGGYPEPLGHAWAGWYGNPGVSPKVGQVYYIKVGWGVSGLPCGGGAHVHPEVKLPVHTRFAISQATPIRCFYWDPDDHVRELTQTCPRNPGGAGIKFGRSFDPRGGEGAWPTATGAMFEIWIPVRSTRPLNGLLPSPGQGCRRCIYAAVWMIDGVYDPWGIPREPVFVTKRKRKKRRHHRHFASAAVRGSGPGASGPA